MLAVFELHHSTLLKPENIVLCKQGDIDDYVKVLDFGIAKVTGRERGPGSHFFTTVGDVVGTPEFMSPEQVQGKAVDARSDIYSLAIVLYELVTAKLPYTARSPMEFMAAHLWEAPIPPSERTPGILLPAGFDGVLLKALSKRPDERFATAREFASALASLLKDSDRTAASARGVGPRHEEAPTMVSAPPLTELGDARIGEIHPTNLRAHEGLRASARMAADSEGDPNARAAEAKRRASALEAIHAIEHTLYQRLERARTDRIMATCLRGALPGTDTRQMTFPQRRLSEMLAGGVRPSLDLLAQLMSTADGAPALAELVRAVLGVPEEVTGELLGVGALRNVLAHQSEYEIDEEAALRGADGWIERVSSRDTTEIRVLPEILDRLAWVAACLLERRVRPREEFGR